MAVRLYAVFSCVILAAVAQEGGFDFPDAFSTGRKPSPGGIDLDRSIDRDSSRGAGDRFADLDRTFPARGQGNRPSGAAADDTVQVATDGKKARPCKEKHCQLPDCFCSGIKTPKDLPAESIPQFVMLTFDDSINPNVAE